jgi:hypothetical protein
MKRSLLLYVHGLWVPAQKAFLSPGLGALLQP